MSRICLVCLCLLVSFSLAASAMAADRDAIKQNVDQVASEINSGTSPEDIQANDYDPYVYVMQDDGMLLVHPELEGESLKELATPVYDAIMQATFDGSWVDYEWKGKQKHAYVRMTDGGLIVGSGYTE